MASAFGSRAIGDERIRLRRELLKGAMAMTTTGLEALDKTIHRTNEWLVGVMHGLRTEDKKAAYTALRAVLHALRDRLPVAAVAGLGAQLPLFVRGLYYEGWRPNPEGHTVHVHTVDRFLELVEREIRPGTEIDAEAASRAVFEVLDRHLDPNETDKIIRLLPRAIQLLWGPPVEPRDS